jgi:hypothetical protein
MFRRFKPLGLGGQMTGDALVEPALNLGSQMNDMGSHNDSPLQVPGSKPMNRATPEYRRQQWI